MSAPLPRPSASSGAVTSGRASSRGTLSGAHQRQIQCEKLLVVVAESHVPPLQRPILLIFAQYKLRPWPPPCQLIPIGLGRLQGCVPSRCTAFSSSRRTSWLVASSSLVVLSLHHPFVLSSLRRLLVLSLLRRPSHPLIVPAIFTAPSPCRGSSPAPSNTVERC
jgi:hypothetical protein